MQMPRTIVVPLDGSKLSESALPLAADLATHLGAKVDLLSSGWGSTTAELTEYLEAKGTELEPGTWSTTVAADTFPATAIATAVDDVETGAVVVMATHGRSGIGKALLGSVAEDVLKTIDRPVLLVGRSAGSVTTLDHRILIVSTDGSETSVSIVDDAIAWAAALQMSVRVVSVTRADGSAVGVADDEPVVERLEAVAGRFRAAGLEAQVERVEAGDAATGLADLARRLPAAMIAMATHGRTGMARTALGSTAMKVVRDAPCPVLVHRPES